MKRAAALMLIGVSAVACAIALDPTVVEEPRPKRKRRPLHVVDLIDWAGSDWAGRPKGGDA